MGWSLRRPRTRGPSPPWPSSPLTPRTFLLRGAGSSNRKASGSVSNPLSVWGEPKASPKYLGLAWGWGGEGVDTPLLPLQCPLVVLLPLSDTSPLSFHGSQAAREAGQRQDRGCSGACPWVHSRFRTDSPGRRPGNSSLESGFPHLTPGSGLPDFATPRGKKKKTKKCCPAPQQAPPLSELQ